MLTVGLVPGTGLQPLYAPGITFSDGSKKTYVIIATQFNSVYAFDAGELNLLIFFVDPVLS